jgi:hypothetical protein
MGAVRNIVLLPLVCCYLLASCGAMAGQRTVRCAISDSLEFGSTTGTASDHHLQRRTPPRHMVMTKVVPVFPLASLNPRAEHAFKVNRGVWYETPPIPCSALRLSSLSDRAPPLS